MAGPKMRHTIPRGTGSWVGPYHAKQNRAEARAKAYRKEKRREIQKLLGRADVTNDDRAVLQRALVSVRIGRKLTPWEYQVLRKYKNNSADPKKKKKVIVGITG